MAINDCLSGLVCLQSIVQNLRRQVNFDALLTGELKENYRTDQTGTVLALAEQLQLGPELKEAGLAGLATAVGPTLVQLADNHWICLIDPGQLEKLNAVVYFDPLSPAPHMVNCPVEQFKRKPLETVIGFRSLQNIDIVKYSRLFCLVSIGKHHGLPLDLRRLMHDYAIGEADIGDRLMARILNDQQMKCKAVKLPWKKLFHLGDAFPLIALKKNGGSLIVCGVRRSEKDGDQLVVVDPANKAEQGGTHFQFWDREQYEENCAGRGWLIKRVYSLSSEEQPFGLRWFIPEFLKLKGVFGQIILAVLMINAIALVTPLFFQIVVDKVLVNETYDTLNVLGVAIILALAFNCGMEFLRSYLLLFATNKIDISTATKTFRHLMRLPIDFFEKVPSGVLLKHMQQTEKIRGFLSGNLFFTVLELLSLVVFVPFLWLYSPPLTGVVLGFALVMALVIALLIKPFQHRLHELYQAEGKRQSRLVESIHGIRTVKSLALEPVEEKAWDDTTAYSINAYFSVGKISITARAISQFLETTMTVTVIWLGALSVFNHTMSIGALIAFQMLSGRVTGPLVKLVSLIHEYQQVALSVRMLGVVMNSRPEPAGGGVRNALKGKVEFDNVTFQYTPDGPQVIRNFSLEINPGTVIGIVGRSGSGKTTLTKLLQGLYPVQQGLVKLDGIDLREIDKAHLRSSIGVVLQENYFFSGTVRENICLTKKSASLEEIIYAAKLAGADEFIQRLQKGYDTYLEENASNLSGGQKQRLAIARALLTNPPILIFDEATSALDPESEEVIQNNLNAISRGRTVLIISHRLSIVSGADRILVLENGERAAFAPHRELMKMPGTYHDFWMQQLGRHQLSGNSAASLQVANQLGSITIS
ncbi:peptidase domain-containing ABC transporter [Victivallis sp. Marseille-Q1083]|uniref:peptidase domain-containing ABC transporter n=1 Tax=Victivallis sp. Marseille-Q1083 TaxID=2717288 RepID=UPI001589B1E8|nr:peptidase domain-containing ABC transporter [Victivallis sp. Marseille-Q1083]